MTLSPRSEPAPSKTARRKLVFIGVSTGGSSIMKIFPIWSRMLGLGCDIVGCDLPLRAPAVRYRRVLQRIIAEPATVGALITAHKIDLLHACRERFDELDYYAEICDEVSCIVKRDGRVLGYAKDPLSSADALKEFVPPRHWSSAPRDVLCLGAGGAAIAISACMARQNPAAGAPRRFILVDIAPERLASARQIHQRLKSPMQFDYRLSRSAADTDALLSALPAGSLVINATGLGKDKPGSPLTAAARFPQGGLVWELNYRGERAFMRQARAQARARGLLIEDGWKYFLHGWTRILAEVFALELDADRFARLSAAASRFRNPQ